MLLCVAASGQKPLIAKIPTIGLARADTHGHVDYNDITYPLVREALCYSMLMFSSSIQ
jgi:hypothetical protein